jgi:hypothetical protein
VSSRYLLGWSVSALRSREGLVLESLALRRQLLALHAKRPPRRLTAPHKAVPCRIENVVPRVNETSRLLPAEICIKSTRLRVANTPSRILTGSLDN